jgi:hypothetical protein
MNYIGTGDEEGRAKEKIRTSQRCALFSYFFSLALDALILGF